MKEFPEGDCCGSKYDISLKVITCFFDGLELNKRLKQISDDPINEFKRLSNQISLDVKKQEIEQERWSEINRKTVINHHPIYNQSPKVDYSNLKYHDHGSCAKSHNLFNMYSCGHILYKVN